MSSMSSNGELEVEIKVFKSIHILYDSISPQLEGYPAQKKGRTKKTNNHEDFKDPIHISYRNVNRIKNSSIIK